MKKITALLFTAIVLFTACKKDKLNTSSPINGLGGDTWVKGDIDRWIYDTLTTPFNMEVLYKWDQFQDGDITKTLVPVEESKVVPILSLINKTWISPYIKEGGINFVKRLIPKQIALIGSPSYNSNGSITLGEAEGGKKILLYNVNATSVTARADVNRLMHTVHHEFGHILHQTILFTPDYEKICAGSYTGDWTNQSLATALSLGFITPYAMSAKDEDFVEMISSMLVEGPDGFDKILATTTDAGAAKLRQKRAIIISYFKTAWNIDFLKLQRAVGEALDAAAPFVTPLSTTMGGGTKQYKSLLMPISFPQPSQRFNDSINKAHTGLTALYASTSPSSDFDSIIISFPYVDTVLMNVKFHFSTNPAGMFDSYFRYKITTNAAGQITFGNVITDMRDTPSKNGNSIKSAVTPLTNFLSGKTLIPQWPNGKPDDRFAPVQVGGIYSTTDPNSFMQGILSDRKM